MKPFVITAAAFLVAAAIGVGVGAFAAIFTPEDLFDVEITPDTDEE